LLQVFPAVQAAVSRIWVAQFMHKTGEANPVSGRFVGEYLTGGDLMNGFDAFCRVPLLGPILKARFTKFATVGVSGMLVNLGVLFVGQELIFRSVHPEDVRLNLSLSLAIFLATGNNFLWNRSWTWRDRRGSVSRHLWVQMGQYFAACWLAIILQFVFTKALAVFLHYLAANVSAIALASVVNYLMNDAWTFSAGALRIPGLPLRSNKR
jgi:dolichol-phosphate mannosyltransferase